MEDAFDEGALEEKLAVIDIWKQNFFHVSVAQRVLPSYAAFSKEERLGNTSILENAFLSVKGAYFGNKEEIDFQKLSKDCLAVAPDTEDFDSTYTSSALDAAIVVSNLAKCYGCFDPALIIESAGLIRDSVDMFLQDLEDLDLYDMVLESKILRHYLMQRELKAQRHTLEYLEGISDDFSHHRVELGNKLSATSQWCLLACKGQA